MLGRQYVTFVLRVYLRFRTLSRLAGRYISLSASILLGGSSCRSILSTREQRRLYPALKALLDLCADVEQSVAGKAKEGIGLWRLGEVRRREGRCGGSSGFAAGRWVSVVGCRGCGWTSGCVWD
jgi:hypothetical protein